ncbi:MAG: hypothetical protein WA160_00635 [Pseudobdellovibrio sp.]
MNKIALIMLFSIQSAYAATLVQTKGNSAIIELTDLELQTLNPSAGQNIQFNVGGTSVAASVAKAVKNKILVKTNKDLTGQKNVQIEIANSVADASTNSEFANPDSAPPANEKNRRAKKDSARTSGNKSMLNKKIIYGVNLKYITGSAKIKYADTIINSIPVSGADFTQNYTGFDLSGTGFYYFGAIGVGVEAEYASINATASYANSTITQMQLSLLSEYKIQNFSAGALLTVASNYKATDNLGNDSSLNAMGGLGVFGTYQVMPNVRMILDYRTISYKLDANTVNTSDIRLGGGYYF